MEKDKTIAGFPDQNIPDAEKDENYIAKYIKAILNTWSNYQIHDENDPGAGLVDKSRFNIYGMAYIAQELRDFSKGLNNGDELKKTYQLNDSDGQGAVTAMNIHFTPSKAQLRVLGAIEHFLTSRDTKQVAYANDPISTGKRIRKKYDRIASIKALNMPGMKEMMGSAGVDITPPEGEPTSMDELDLFEGMSIKDAETMKLTGASLQLRANCRYDAIIRPQLADELIATGINIVAYEVNQHGLPIPKVVKVEDAVLPWTENNFEDKKWCGYFRWLSFSELKAEVGEQFNDDDYKYALSFVNKPCRTDTVDGLGTFTRKMEGKIPVFTGFFMDYLHDTIAEKDGNHGKVKKVIKGNRPMDGKWRTEIVGHEVVFKGNYIVGSVDGQMFRPDNGGQNIKTRELHWGQGLTKNMVRFTNDPYQTKLPMTVVAHNMTNMRVLSLASLARDKVIEINDLYIKFRNHIAHIIPPGFGPIDEGTLSNTALFAKGDNKERARAVIESLKATGSAQLNMKLDPDDPYSPVTNPFNIHGGFIGEIERILGAIDYCKNDLNQIFGLNDAALGNTTDSKQLVGTLRIQLQGSATALGTLHRNWDRLELEIALMSYGIFQCSLMDGHSLDIIGEQIGDPMFSYLKFTAADDPGSIGIYMEMQMSDDDKLSLSESVNKAVASGEVSIVQAAMLLKMKNFQMAMRRLELWGNARAEKAHQRQLEVAKANQEGSVQAAQIQAQNQQQLFAAKAEGDANMVTVKVDKEIEKAQIQHALDMDKLRADAQAKLEETIIKQQTLMDINLDKMQKMFEMNTRQLEAKKDISKDEIDSREKIASMPGKDTGK